MLSDLATWNAALSQALIAPVSSLPGDLSLARFCAADLIVIAACVPLVIWLLGPDDRRAAALTAGLVAVLALGANLLVGMVWCEPRPFMLGLVPNWLGHAADGGFPSDHATAMWGLGLPLLAGAGCRRWGAAVMVLGAATAWGRIRLGVHFPLDMLGSLIVALVCTGAAPLALRVIRRHLVPAMTHAQDKALRGWRDRRRRDLTRGY